MPSLFIAIAQTMHGMPPDSWWVAIAVLFLLGALAVVDAMTARIPDPYILPSLMLITLVQGYYVNWPFAGRNLLIAFVVAFALFLVNEAWFHVGKRDALGMGDAKWTMLAVACFGIMPSVVAWIIGAWLAIAWILVAKVAKHRIKRVHFAPFLFIGLLVGIYWLRVKLLVAGY